jgi:peptidoglycan/LPS O-acetylase OafA/YrhL
VLLFYAVFTFNKETPFPSLYTLVPTVGTALIILFADKQTVTGRLLGNQVLVGIGLISYSAYLWHQPLFAFARHRNIEEPIVINSTLPKTLRTNISLRLKRCLFLKGASTYLQLK